MSGTNDRTVAVAGRAVAGTVGSMSVGATVKLRVRVGVAGTVEERAVGSAVGVPVTPAISVGDGPAPIPGTASVVGSVVGLEPAVAVTTGASPHAVRRAMLIPMLMNQRVKGVSIRSGLPRVPMLIPITPYYRPAYGSSVSSNENNSTQTTTLHRLRRIPYRLSEVAKPLPALSVRTPRFVMAQVGSVLPKA